MNHKTIQTKKRKEKGNGGQEGASVFSSSGHFVLKLRNAPERISTPDSSTLRS